MDGQATLVAIDIGEEKPDPHVLIEEFSKLLKAQAQSNEVLATALCFDSLVSKAGEEGQKKDAIAVRLEHENGESMVVYVPYKKNLFGGYKYDSFVAEAGERKYFT